MDISLTIGETCILVLAIALFILILYCIFFIKNLIPSVKILQRILENTETITSNVAKGTVSVENVVEDVADISSSVLSSVKSRTTLLGQISSISSAVKTIITLINDHNANKSDEDNNNSENQNKNASEESSGKNEASGSEM